MKSRKPLVCLTIAVVMSALGAAQASGHHPPSNEEILTAAGTADLMTNTVVAALLQEIGETTPENAAQGSQSISLVFNDENHDMRLVGALDPLRENDYPEDDFEEGALDNAMAGVPTTGVERVRGKWYYRRSIPLSNFQPECAMCHANFVGLSSNDWVGALMLRVPIVPD